MAKFALPATRDLRFERTQSEILKRAEFVMDDAKFVEGISSGAITIGCALAIAALLGLFWS